MKIKNKILSFVLALCLIIPCALVFTACGDKDPEAPATVYVTEETTLASAINQVANGGKVILNVDVVLNEEVAVAKKVTLDLNGKKISNTTYIYDESVNHWSLISVQTGGDLTVTGEGVMWALADDCYAFDCRGGKLTIENGIFIGNISAIYVHTGEAIINGGNYAIQQLATGDVVDEYSLLINCYNANYANDTANITINGGNFVGYNPAAYTANEGNFLADGLTVTSSSQTIPGTAISGTVYTVVPALAQ